MTYELAIILTGVVCTVLGFAIASLIWLKRLYGMFIIDCTDPNKDICRIELESMDLDALARKKYIVLEVNAMFDENSQK